MGTDFWKIFLNLSQIRGQTVFTITIKKERGSSNTPTKKKKKKSTSVVNSSHIINEVPLVSGGQRQMATHRWQSQCVWISCARFCSKNGGPAPCSSPCELVCLFSCTSWQCCSGLLQSLCRAVDKSSREASGRKGWEDGRTITTNLWGKKKKNTLISS